MFKIINDGQLPTRGSKYSACVDLYAREDVVIGAGETILVPLGVCIDLYALKANYIEYNKVRDIEAGLPPLSNTFENKYFNNEFLNSHYLQLMLRSSLGKKGLILPNGVGAIDMDYKDEIKMIIHNPMTKNSTHELINVSNLRKSDFHSECIIKKGDKIGQITLLEHKAYLFGIETDVERTGGFGSTSKEK